MTDFLFLGSKTTGDNDFSHEIKRCLLLGRKAMTNLDSILKSKDITLLTKGHSQSYSFSSCHIWMWDWTIKKAEHQRIDAFELWCWRRVLRVPWTARKSNQSILREISPEYSLAGLMLKLTPVLQPPDSKLLFSRSLVFDSLWPHGLQHARLSCPSHLLELAQSHVHWVGDAIQPSHPLSSPSPPAFSLSQHQVLF